MRMRGRGFAAPRIFYTKPNTERGGNEMDLFSFSRMAAIFEKYSGHFLKGAEMALILSLITVCCATVFGTLFALCKMSKIKPLKWIVSAYI